MEIKIEGLKKAIYEALRAVRILEIKRGQKNMIRGRRLTAS